MLGKIFSSITKQSGQAAIEYTLLLVILVAMAGGLATKFFKPAGDFANKYMGEYTQCLLDAGELPNIAGGSPTECQVPQANFSAAGSSGSASGSSSNSNSNSSNSSSQASANASKNAAKAEAEAAAERRNRNASSNNRNNSRNRGFGNGGGQAVNQSGPGGDGGAPSTTKLAVKSKRDGFRNSSSATGSSNGVPVVIRAKGLSGVLPPESAAPSIAEQQAAREVREDELTMKPKRVLLKPPERKTASMQESEGGFSFGGLLRIALIVIIIGAIVYVVSTQINSISKGMEK